MAVKSAQQALDILEEKTNKIRALIEQYKTEVFELQDKRDKLEERHVKASTLIMAGKLTIEEYTENKEELSALNRAIDEKQEFLDVFEKSLDSDYPRKFQSLNNDLSGRKRILTSNIAKNLATKIAE